MSEGRGSRAVVLLSGGLDSATALAEARAAGFETYALTVLYGQRHAIEREAARRVARALGVTRHIEQAMGVIELDAELEVLLDNILNGDWRGDGHATRLRIFGKQRRSVVLDLLVRKVRHVPSHLYAILICIF